MHPLWLSIKKTNVCNINGIEYDFTDILYDINNSQRTPASYIGQISDKCNIPIYKAKEIYFKIKNNSELPQNVKCENKQQPNTPKCPTCGSTNIEKISGLSKAGSVAMWGIFSRKVHKQWHCNNCKSDF